MEENNNTIESPWLNWLHNHAADKLGNEKARYALNTYDKLCELAVSSYELNQRNRNAALKDRCQYFLLWWMSNRKYMKYYVSYMKIGELLGINHATVIHHVSKRKPTHFYSENIKCIKDFLTDSNEEVQEPRERT
jgi:hypothetical protein